MGRNRRGRDRVVTCVSCGRSVPRSKAVSYNRRSRFSSDLKNDQDVFIVSESVDDYCISCAKHRGITQKKKEQMMRRRERF